MSICSSRRSASSASAEILGSDTASVINVARVGQTLPPSPARLRVMPTPGNVLPSHLAGDYVSTEMENEVEELEAASPVARVSEGPKSKGVRIESEA